jgi:Mrp family chromosome partitioning ATPase
MKAMNKLTIRIQGRTKTGKSTTARFLQAQLNKAGYRVQLTDNDGTRPGVEFTAERLKAVAEGTTVEIVTETVQIPKGLRGGPVDAISIDDDQNIAERK